MRILFLGAGAVGGYFGGRLMEVGADVTFLVRPRRQAQLLSDGLVVASPHGDIRLPTQTTTKARAGFDLVVLTCKAYDLDGAIDSIRPAMEGGAVVMPLLNGLNHMEVLDRTFGRDKVMGGLCHIPITLEPDGTIRHLSTIHRLAFGARAPAQEPLVQALAAAFTGARVDWKVTPDVMLDLWEKFVFLSTLAGATCLMRASVGAIASQPGGADFLRAMYEEARATGAAEGYAPRPEAVADSLAQLTDADSAMTASMMRDVARGNRVEHEHILGDMVRRAGSHGLGTPNLAMALLALRAYEHERRKRVG